MSESADVGVDEDMDGDEDVDGDLNVAVGDESPGHVAVAVHDDDNDNDDEVRVEGPPCRFEAERAARGFAGPALPR